MGQFDKLQHQYFVTRRSVLSGNANFLCALALEEISLGKLPLSETMESAHHFVVCVKDCVSLRKLLTQHMKIQTQ